MKFDISKDTIPENLKHIAIIMDGNGRWAKKKLKARFFGYTAGSKATRNIINISTRAGLKVLSLFAFSTENWNRPDKEISYLKKIFKAYLIKEKTNLIKNNIIFRVSGSYSRFGDEIVSLVQDLLDATKNNTGMILNLCVSYGGRQDIVEAVKNILKEQKKIKKIDEKVFSKYFEMRDLPDPDLLIRTSGEQRISNFMLWQLAYTELYFSDVFWPEFTSNEYNKAINSYLNRKRRFGFVDIKQKP